jgi:hypothetical protein
MLHIDQRVNLAASIPGQKRGCEVGVNLTLRKINARISAILRLAEDAVAR